jgi:transposase
VRAVEAGASCRATAAKFEVSVSFVVKLMQRWRRRGTVLPDKYGGWKRSPLADPADRVLALVTETPDLTLEELRSRLVASGIRTSRSALGRCLQNQGLTRKTRPGTPPSRTARTWLRRAPGGGSSSRC